MTGGACTLAGEPGSVAVARGWVSDVLRAHGWGGPLTGTAALVTSELVTNAVKYTDGPVRVELLTGTDRVRISVIDAGTKTGAPVVPRSPPCPALPQAPRGLYLVDQWAQRITVHGGPQGHTVVANIVAPADGCGHANSGAATPAGTLPHRTHGAALGELRAGPARVRGADE